MHTRLTDYEYDGEIPKENHACHALHADHDKRYENGGPDSFSASVHTKTFKLHRSPGLNTLSCSEVTDSDESTKRD